MTSLPVALSNIPQSIDECLSTFDDWPEYTSVTPENLAKTGFYYLGEKLKVKCYMCGLEVDDWCPGMTAFGTHSQRSNTCEIIRAIRTTKTEDSQCVHEKWRLKTLDGLTFNTNNDEHLYRELAACGFFRVRTTENIRCAYCGVIIRPKSNQSIMSQHRLLAKRSKRSSKVDCLMVRAQCPTNIIIQDRERFPEYPEYQSVFNRIKSFENYKEQTKVLENFIRERADAGFFLSSKNFNLNYCFFVFKYMFIFK